VNKYDQADYIQSREGYLDLPQKPVYAAVPKAATKSRGGHHLISISTEERIGSLIAATGTVWGVYQATVDYAHLWRFDILRPGPLEVCALGILIWLHAKWRRSTKVG
jgi:hypothetical protein